MAGNLSGNPVLLDPMAFRAWLPAESLTLGPEDPELAIRAADRELTDAKGEMVHDRGVEAMVHLPLLLGNGPCVKPPCSRACAPWARSAS